MLNLFFLFSLGSDHVTTSAYYLLQVLLCGFLRLRNLENGPACKAAEVEKTNGG